jgi:spermidine synthase
MTAADDHADAGAGHAKLSAMPGRPDSPLTRWGALALAFFASAAVLIIEILAGRLLAPYVGVSLDTYTGVIGTVLAGIAIGSALGGRAADRADPRTLVGPTLIAGGVLAMLSLPAVSYLGPRLLDSDRRVAIVALAVAGFVLPTAVLSAIAPMVAKMRISSTAEAGTVVGGVSAAGTAGALVGTFVTGFVLVAAWPTRPIIIAVGLALVVGGFALSARRRADDGAFVGLVAPGLLALMAAWFAATSATPCAVETAYFCAAVHVDPERASGRVLMLDDLRHSYVDLEDPTHLEFRYEELFAHVADSAAPEADAALHIGGGGFTFPRWLLATRPTSSQQVLELDPDVVELAERRLGLRRSPQLAVAAGDARTGIRAQPTAGYDLAVGDAFGGRSVPWHLTTVEFVTEVRRTLRDDGVYMLNVIDGGDARFARAEAATLREVFAHVAVIAPPSSTYGNYVLIGSDRPLRVPPPDTNLGELLPDEHVDAFIGDSMVLRDDFAPVDQLIAVPA